MKNVAKLIMVAMMFSAAVMFIAGNVEHELKVREQRAAEFEAKVRASDSFIRRHVVMLVSSVGTCSGVMVQGPSGKFYILSASHCAESNKEQFQVLSDVFGKMGKVKIVAIDRKSDLLLLEPVQNQTLALPIAKTLERHDEVRSFGYGMGLPNRKSSGELLILNNSGMNDICQDESRRYVISNVFIIPGDSGGPIVSSKGEIVGIAQAYDRYTGFACLGLLGNIQRFMADK